MKTTALLLLALALAAHGTLEHQADVKASWHARAEDICMHSRLSLPDAPV
jgi:hypothetical protein